MWTLEQKVLIVILKEVDEMVLNIYRNEENR